MEPDQGKLFVGGISRETSEVILKDHFGKYGTVLSSVVAKDRNTKSPRGFGFVLFSEPSTADRALQDTHVILGRTSRGFACCGDVLALLLFSAIGRYNHGLPVFAMDTLHTADPFLAGWFLSAYFLGGYGEDGRGANGLSKAVIAAAKSWGLGIPLGLIIRAATSGHIPPYTFVLVTMGSTSVLLIGWRALVISIFLDDTKKKNDVYRRGSPFELFELLASLVRRW